MYGRIGDRGHNVLFGQRLDTVGNRLHDAEWSNAVGANAVLNARQPLALEDSGQCEERREDADNGDNSEQH